jgi:hypothetical protein
MQQFVLSHTCRAGALVGVWIARQHRHSCALNLRVGVGAGKISCSPHPLRSTKCLSAAWWKLNQLFVVTSSARRCSPEPQQGGERRRLAFNSAILVLIGRSKAQLAAVKSHPVHNHRELARDRNDGALVTPLGCDP